MVDGITLWDEYRLEEEGIENVQNLATADLITLALKTHFNFRTLLDWVDQAVLIDRMDSKAITLREKGLISGAIDMAWASPSNANGDMTIANLIGETVDVEPTFVALLMDSLYEDRYVRMLWTLWQSQLEAGTEAGKRAKAVKKVTKKKK